MPRQTDRASSSSTATLQKRYSTNTGHKACFKPDLLGPAGGPSPGSLNHWFQLRLPPVKDSPVDDKEERVWMTLEPDLYLFHLMCGVEFPSTDTSQCCHPALRAPSCPESDTSCD
ncbi:unnamed protein product [Natator depressus]